MRKIRADKMVAATSLLTLALVAAPRVTHAKEATTTSGGEAQIAAVQEAAEAETYAPALTDVKLVEAEGQSQQVRESILGTATAEPSEQAMETARVERAVAQTDEMFLAESSGAQAMAAQVNATDGDARQVVQAGTADGDMRQNVRLDTADAGAQASPADDASQQDTSFGASVAAQHGRPVITIYVDERSDTITNASINDPQHSYGSYFDMYNSGDHSVRCVGEVAFDVPEGFTSEDGDMTVPTDPIKLKYVRGCGDSTGAGDDKKAYELAFEDAQGFFGMPESKEWALQSSAWGDAMASNHASNWQDVQKGSSEGTPRLVPVELVIVTIGDGGLPSCTELGRYYLSESGEELDIDASDENAVDNGEAPGDNLPTIDNEAPGDNFPTIDNDEQNTYDQLLDSGDTNKVIRDSDLPEECSAVETNDDPRAWIGHRSEWVESHLLMIDCGNSSVTAHKRDENANKRSGAKQQDAANNEQGGEEPEASNDVTCEDSGAPVASNAEEAKDGDRAERTVEEAGSPAAASDRLTPGTTNDASSTAQIDRDGASQKRSSADTKPAHVEANAHGAVRALLPATNDAIYPVTWVSCLMTSLLALVVSLFLRSQD